MVIAFKAVLIKEVLYFHSKWKIIWRFESQLCFKKLTFFFFFLSLEIPLHYTFFFPIISISKYLLLVCSVNIFPISRISFQYSSLFENNTKENEKKHPSVCFCPGSSRVGRGWVRKKSGPWFWPRQERLMVQNSSLAPLCSPAEKLCWVWCCAPGYLDPCSGSWERMSIDKKSSLYQCVVPGGASSQKRLISNTRDALARGDTLLLPLPESDLKLWILPRSYV